MHIIDFFPMEKPPEEVLENQEATQDKLFPVRLFEFLDKGKSGGISLENINE
jgi:hypothetical protein